MVFFIILAFVIFIIGIMMSIKEETFEKIIIAVCVILIAGTGLSAAVYGPRPTTTERIPLDSSCYENRAVSITHMPGLKEPLADKTTYVSRNFWNWGKEPETTQITAIYADLSGLSPEKPWEPQRIEADLNLAPRKGPIQ